MCHFSCIVLCVHYVFKMVLLFEQILHREMIKERNHIVHSSTLSCLKYHKNECSNNSMILRHCNNMIVGFFLNGECMKLEQMKLHPSCST